MLYEKRLVIMGIREMDYDIPSATRLCGLIIRELPFFYKKYTTRDLDIDVKVMKFYNKMLKDRERQEKIQLEFDF
jgi:hypothetical protein